MAVGRSNAELRADVQRAMVRYQAHCDLEQAARLQAESVEADEQHRKLEAEHRKYVDEISREIKQRYERVQEAFRRKHELRQQAIPLRAEALRTLCDPTMYAPASVLQRLEQIGRQRALLLDSLRGAKVDLRSVERDALTELHGATPDTLIRRDVGDGAALLNAEREKIEAELELLGPDAPEEKLAKSRARLARVEFYVAKINEAQESLGNAQAELARLDAEKADADRALLDWRSIEIEF